MDRQTSNHLRLAVRPGTYWPYVIAGDRDNEIGCHYSCVGDAETAIRAFCRGHRLSATVRVFTPRNKLWKVDRITAAGNVSRTTPEWLLRPPSSPTQQAAT